MARIRKTSLIIPILILVLPLIGCSVEVIGIDHAQGEMAGEVTTDSVILQSRLTAICAKNLFVNCTLRGAGGVGRFEIADNPSFQDSTMTEWIDAVQEKDFMIKKKVSGLNPGTDYYYRLLYGKDLDTVETGGTCTFRTLDLQSVEREVSFVAVTGMNYFVFHFFPGPPNKPLGYPALETILNMDPDFFVGTGDNVYYDAFPIPAATKAAMRHVWHMQFVQPRFVSLFSQVPTYWEKDDHDHRYNDSDPYGEEAPSNALGIQTFLEQVPVVDPEEPDPITYRTIRVNKLLQIWLTEGRDYRSPNDMDDGPNKTLWGATQKAWLEQTLLASDATFKLLISPTPMVGPDDISLPWPFEGQPKRDNHTNPGGFRTEGDAFFSWLQSNGFLNKNFYIICGDRHWKYHSIRPDGFEEFSTGALVDANSRLGRVPGDPDSTDPDGDIVQPYIDDPETGGFLNVVVRPGEGESPATCEFTLYDENGVMLYTITKDEN